MTASQSVHLRARRAREPRRMSALVGRRARAVLGRHQRAVAQPFRSGDAARNVAMPMPASIGSFALRAARRLRRRAAQRHLARRRRRQPRAQGRAAAVRSGASPVQRRPLRSAGPLRRRLDEREARRGQRRTAIGSMLDFTLTRLFGNITISNGLAWSPDGRTMYHADTPAQTVRAYDYDARSGTAGAAAGRSRTGTARRERPDGGAVDSAGNYWMRVLPRRQDRAAVAAWRARRRIPGAGDVPDDVRVRRPRSAHALRDDRRGSSARTRSSRACRRAAAFSRCASTCPACPKRAFRG